MIRPLTAEDLEDYLAHCIAHHAESGRDGDAYSGPYGRDEPFPVDDVRTRTRDRWTRALDTPGWRRAWGVFDESRIIGSANVQAGAIAAELHRVNLGISVQRPYRRQGFGRALLETVVTWCREQPTIEWIDLGVFAGNVPAETLFHEMGFRSLAVVEDRWRVDGLRIRETMMTLHVPGLE